MIRKSIALLVTTSMLSACYSFRGPEPVIERGRVIHDDARGPREGYLFQRFRQATLAASGCPDETPAVSGAATRSATSEPVCFQRAVSQAQIDEFMRSGYALIYADCADYFAHMGRRQRGSRLFRDSVAPIGALISGIISIVRFDNSQTRDDLLAVLALTTTAGTSALDVYDQNFLFNADNIDAVRRLVQDGLTAHANRTFQTDIQPHSFDRAASHLADNQAICSPSSILSLVRDAIRSGRIVARVPVAPTQQGAGGVAPAGSQPAPGSDRVSIGTESPL